jgi:hypothetical protein
VPELLEEVRGLLRRGRARRVPLVAATAET